MNKVQFNEARALEVLPVLAALWSARGGIFKGEKLPQELWTIRGGDKTQAHWFFYVAHTMRGGLVSEDPFKWLFHVREKFRDIFEPEMVVRKWKPAQLKHAFLAVTKEMRPWPSPRETKGVGTLGYKLDELTEHWHYNSRILARHWDGNILKVFDGASDFEDAFGRIDWKRVNGTGFKGMRRKIFSLFTIFLQEQRIVPRFPTPIPVDFHALRVLWATGVIDIETKPLPENPRYPKILWGRQYVRISEEIADSVAKWSQKFLTPRGISHLLVNPALWVLSRKLCAEQLQNASRENGSFFFLPELLRNVPNLWPEHYTNPCGICPLERWCTKALPRAPYYTCGLLVPLERVPYPQDFLNGIDWQHHITPKSKKGRGNGNSIKM